ncbi:uncharacterized protein EV422DRAFT_510153 [Fimicolochytrium jonesii]|uniref:uncharacterized protein n=1 Tax=Fimicolochytrium jonesii TaxID=1396493 RepID=UPI0022FEDF84|nr:uncharacterized protein EV422DRAFT_510153 [Fimicolochytrium jonesii]KAI8816028.1 hypothetical protein EV422DRAFT_510153 [Fimicolochytrium jonesii]
MTTYYKDKDRALTPDELRKVQQKVQDWWAANTPTEDALDSGDREEGFLPTAEMKEDLGKLSRKGLLTLISKSPVGRLSGTGQMTETVMQSESETDDPNRTKRGLKDKYGEQAKTAKTGMVEFDKDRTQEKYRLHIPNGIRSEGVLEAPTANANDQAPLREPGMTWDGQTGCRRGMDEEGSHPSGAGRLGGKALTKSAGRSAGMGDTGLPFLPRGVRTTMSGKEIERDRDTLVRKWQVGDEQAMVKPRRRRKRYQDSVQRARYGEIRRGKGTVGEGHRFFPSFDTAVDAPRFRVWTYPVMELGLGIRVITGLGLGPTYAASGARFSSNSPQLIHGEVWARTVNGHRACGKSDMPVRLRSPAHKEQSRDAHGQNTIQTTSEEQRATPTDTQGHKKMVCATGAVPNALSGCMVQQLSSDDVGGGAGDALVGLGRGRSGGALVDRVG